MPNWRSHRSLILRPLLAGVSVLAMPLAATAQEAIVLDTVIVTGDRDGTGPGDGYVAAVTTTGSKTPTEVKSIPRSISTVTRKQMDDRAPVQLGDTIAYSSGAVSSNWGVDDRYDQFLIRGFDIGSTGVFRDGLSQKVISFSAFKVEPYGLQRVEVFKGPSGVLYGENEVGGMVNAISKRPTFDHIGGVYTGVGSHGTLEAGLDVGGAVSKNSNWAYRFTGLVRDGANEIKGSQNDRLYLAPALTWQPDAQTRLTILAKYQKDRLTPNSFYAVPGRDYDASYGNLPDSFIYSQSSFNRFNTEAASIGYELEKEFDDGLTLRQNLRYASQTVDYRHLYRSGMTNATTMNYSAFTVDETARFFTVDNQAQYKFEAGSIENTALLGLDYSHIRLSGQKGFNNSYNISILNPSFDFVVTEPAIYNSGKQTISRTGLYFQNQMKIADHWNLTTGVRMSWVGNQNDNFLNSTKTKQNDQALTKMIGLSYDFNNGVTPYVSYGESFTTNVGTGFGGNFFKPSKGRQYEVGVKYKPDSFNGFFTAALFDITKSNALTPDPDHLNFSVQTGEVRHRGLEVEGNFDITSGLSMTASYTYLDARVTRSNGGDVGNRVTMAPVHQASAWANYKVQSERLNGLSFGAGLRYVGQTWGDKANTISVSPYVLADAAIRYDFGKMEASLNIGNVFNRRYNATCAPNAGCILGEGRSVFAKLTAKF